MPSPPGADDFCNGKHQKSLDPPRIHIEFARKGIVLCAFFRLYFREFTLRLLEHYNLRQELS
jgi:hypothetical protein